MPEAIVPYTDEWDGTEKGKPSPEIHRRLSDKPEMGQRTLWINDIGGTMYILEIDPVDVLPDTQIHRPRVQ